MDLHDKAWKAESYQRYAKAAPIMASLGKNWHKTNAVSDYDFIYGFTQIMDPMTGVQTGEQRMLAAAQSLPEALYGAVVKSLNGEQKLSRELRGQIMDFLHNRVGSYKEAVETEHASLAKTAKRFGIDPEDALPPLSQLLQREEFFKGTPLVQQDIPEQFQGPQAGEVAVDTRVPTLEEQNRRRDREEAAAAAAAEAARRK